MTLGIGILTRNRPLIAAQTVAAVRKFTSCHYRLAIGVDHDPETADLLRRAGEHVVEPAARGIPANRNRLLAELADCDYIALLEDDHRPAVPGWQWRYTSALQEGVVGVVWRLGDASGPVLRRCGRVWWRTALGCPLVVLTRRAYELVGAWNQDAFADRYGLDDGEWAWRAYWAGMAGPFRGLWPGVDDHGLSITHVVDPPSSDGKTAKQRAADTQRNWPAFDEARAGVSPIWQPNPEAA